MAQRIFVLFLLFFGPALATAGDIMFEGYYRIDLESKPIGYLILRYEFDNKAHQFHSISFQRAKLGNKIVQESLHAVATDKFQPVSYQYTAQLGDEVKTIDATFKPEIMTLVKTDGKKTKRTETYKIPKGTFLSSFLTYIMMQKKIDLNEAFQYKAVAEEDGLVFDGKSWFESKQERGDYVLFRVLNTFKGEKFVSSLAAVPDPGNPGHFMKGEVMGTNSPIKNVSTELMANPAKATEGQMLPNKILLTLFSTMPTGKLNLVASPPTKPAPAAIATPAKAAPQKEK